METVTNTEVVVY